MSTAQTTTEHYSSAESTTMLSSKRGLIVLEGIIQLILGLLFLTTPGWTTIGMIQFLGFYFLIRGTVHIVQIFTKKNSIPWGWLLTAGVLGIISGLLILQHPVISSIVTLRVMVYFILFTGLFQGITSIYQGFSGEGFWSVVLGLVVSFVCLFLLFNPFGTGLMIPLLAGFLLLFSGIASLVFALFFKKE